VIKPKRGRPTDAERELRFEKGLTQAKNNNKKKNQNQLKQIEFYALKTTRIVNN
jgi:hypothetical protein